MSSRRDLTASCDRQCVLPGGRGAFGTLVPSAESALIADDYESDAITYQHPDFDHGEKVKKTQTSLGEGAAVSSLRRAKIICTIGPACDSEAAMRDLMRLGMDVARLNFSHGTHEDHGRATSNACAAAAERRKAHHLHSAGSPGPQNPHRTASSAVNLFC